MFASPKEWRGRLINGAIEEQPCLQFNPVMAPHVALPSRNAG